MHLLVTDGSCIRAGSFLGGMKHVMEKHEVFFKCLAKCLKKAP